MSRDTRTVKRVTLSLDIDIADSLTRTARRMGMSRSALVSMMLKQAMPAVEALMSVLPETDIDAEDIKRYRGKSIEIITEQFVDGMNKLGPDLFEDDG